MPASSRVHLPLVDTLKGVCCLLIVCHHLAFYGPMSDIARPLAPALLDWMAGDARMAVQVFLVVGGFLAAGALAPAGRARFDRPGPLILRRYRRLAMPYLAALGLCVLASAAARPWMAAPELLPDLPRLPQMLAHTLFLQDLLGLDALSAGVWYVAIDFQLFAVTALLLALAQRLGRLGNGGRPWLDRHLGHALIGGLAALSLLYFNRLTDLDDTAFYFFGAYGLGMLAYWAGGSSRPRRWTGLIAAVGLLALALDWRGRIAVALASALMLAWMRQRQAARLRKAFRPVPAASDAPPPHGGRSAVPSVLERLGRISYSIFLVHYPVCILVSLAVGHWWPADPLANACGMAAALLLSTGAGLGLHHAVERRADSWRGMGRLLAILLACGLLARWLDGIA